MHRSTGAIKTSLTSQVTKAASKFDFNQARGYKTPIGKVTWCYLPEPRLNLNNQLQWEIGIEISEAELEPVADLVGDLLDAHRIKNPSFPREDDQLSFPWQASRGPKGDDGTRPVIDGMWILKAKKAKTRRDMRTGQVTENPTPLIVDSFGRPVQPGTITQIGRNSRVRASVDLFAFDKAGKQGVGCALRAVQIVELNTDQGDTFDAVEGGSFGAAGDDFDDALG